MNRIIQVKDIVELNQATYKKDEFPETVKYLDTSSLTKNRIQDFQLLNTKTDIIPSRAQRKVRENTILYSTVRPNQEHFGIIERPLDNIIVSTGFTTLDIIDKEISPKYFYYLLTQPHITEYLHTIATNSVSAYPSISPNDIGNLKFRVPDLSTQQKIASVLSALDSKIELNNRINAELEAMAKTLYDYWFVQFDFPDKNGKHYKTSDGKMVWNEELKREIPEGWEVKPFSFFSDKIGDGIHGTPEYVDDSVYSFINGNNLKNGFVEIENDTKKVSVVEYEKYFIDLNEGSILLSINGTLGNLAVYTGEKVMLGKSAAYINCKSNNRPYCYQYLKLESIQKKLWNIATGSTIKNLSLDSIKNLLIPFPGDILIKCYYEYAKPLDEKRKNIFQENQKLTELRDWLLPMLMNGQVKVMDEMENELAMAAEPKIEYGK